MAQRFPNIHSKMRRTVANCAIAVVGLCVPTAAAATFAVCNQSFDVVNVAVGQFEDDDFVTRGWWTIGPNQCANTIRDQLTARYIYIFAQDVFGNEILSGSTPLCVGTARFSIRWIPNKPNAGLYF